MNNQDIYGRAPLSDYARLSDTENAKYVCRPTCLCHCNLLAMSTSLAQQWPYAFRTINETYLVEYMKKYINDPLWFHIRLGPVEEKYIIMCLNVVIPVHVCTYNERCEEYQTIYYLIHLLVAKITWRSLGLVHRDLYIHMYIYIFFFCKIF